MSALRTFSRTQHVAQRAALGARASAALPRSISTRRHSSTMHDNDPDLLEQEKSRNLQNIQHKTSTPHEKHAPGWNEYLASASEASVKADKHDSDDIQELTQKTVRHVKIRHHGEDQTVGVESVVEKDEVEGPLKKL